MIPIDSATYYLWQLTSLLFSVNGFFLLIGYASIVALLLVWSPMKWCLISVLLFVSSLQVGDHKWIANYQLAFPMENIRIYARPLTILLVSTLFFTYFSVRQNTRTRLIVPAVLLFMIFQYTVALRLFFAGSYERWLISTITFAVVHIALIFMVGRWLQTMQDVYRLLYALTGGAALIVLMTVYQLIVNPSMAVFNTRLYGITGNPQFMGLIMAFLLPPALFLAFGPYVNRKLRPWMMILASLMVILMMWTGSRTGFLTAFIGVSFMFYRHYSRLILAAGIVTVLFFFLVPFFEGSLDIAERLLSTEDTRTNIWIAMMDGFYNNPLIGTNEGFIQAVENSYITVLSQTGLMGFLPLAISGLLLLGTCHRLRLMRSGFSGSPMILDLIVGFWFAVAVSAMFEGYLLGAITTPILIVFLMSTMTVFLCDIDDKYGHSWTTASLQSRHA